MLLDGNIKLDKLAEKAMKSQERWIEKLTKKKNRLPYYTLDSFNLHVVKHINKLWYSTEGNMISNYIENRRLTFITISCRYCLKFKIQFRFKRDKQGIPYNIEFNRYLHGKYHDLQISHY